MYRNQNGLGSTDLRKACLHSRSPLRNRRKHTIGNDLSIAKRPMHWCCSPSTDLSILRYFSPLFASLANKEMYKCTCPGARGHCHHRPLHSTALDLKVVIIFRKRIVLPQKEIVICTWPCTGGLCATAWRQCSRENSVMFSSPHMQDDSPRSAATKFGTRFVARWFAYATPCCARRLARGFRL